MDMKKEGISEEPFIHLFCTSQSYYLYDVNKDKILQIPEEVYSILENKSGEASYRNRNAVMYIENLKNMGYLKTNRVSISEHPMSEVLEYYLQNKMSHIVLQVTQSCNLRCEYCIYSGGYNNRSHTNKKMSLDTAQKAVDYLIRHSKDSDRIGFSFYGGEPLLAFDLVQKCVLYAEERAEGRLVDFNFTTNGTLLTEDIIEFLTHHNFNILISLDGPEEIHDRHRRFAGNGRGSFETIVKNLKRIQDKFPDFYHSRVSFNTVFDSQDAFSCVNEFLLSSQIFDKVRLNSTLINSDYAKEEIPTNQEFFAELKYEIFKLYLSKTGWIGKDNLAPIAKSQFRDIKRLAVRLKEERQTQLPEISHRGGTCLPGGQKLFVNADGNLYPCERVSETSDAALLGNIDQGIDLEKAKELLNLEKLTADSCHDCWAYYYCKICITKSDDGNKISGDMIRKSCDKIKNDLENDFKDFCVLSELGYNPETDEDDMIDQEG